MAEEKGGWVGNWVRLGGGGRIAFTDIANIRSRLHVLSNVHSLASTVIMPEAGVCIPVLGVCFLRVGVDVLLLGVHILVLGILNMVPPSVSTLPGVGIPLEIAMLPVVSPWGKC